MIYAIKLPNITCERLRDIVLLQMALLDYAITELNSVLTLEAESTKNTESTKENKGYWRKKKEENCIAYFNTLPDFKERSQGIAQWLWEANATTRQGHLENFARVYISISTEAEGRKREEQDKKDWCARLRREIEDLFKLDDTPLTIQPFNESSIKSVSCDKLKKTDHWKLHAKCFLLYFYEYYLSGGDKPFPDELFSGPSLEKFSRQVMLKAFLHDNPDQEICPTCDEMRYYSQGENIHTDLDHYFPKGKYPHLSCHPYNLVPSCSNCNAGEKSDTDPLVKDKKTQERRTIDKHILPYRKLNLSRVAYLEVKAGAQPEQFISIGEIKQRPSDAQNIPASMFKDVTSLLHDLYNIPGRWQKTDQTLRISDTLFRRMSQFLGDGKSILVGSDIPTEVSNTLKQLLYFLDQEDQQKDPFAFAMTWVLGAIIRQQQEEKTFSEPFVKEINSWFGQDFEEGKKRNKHAEYILEFLKESRQK